MARRTARPLGSPARPAGRVCDEDDGGASEMIPGPDHMSGRFATLTFERQVAAPAETLWQAWTAPRSEEHTSELQSLMRISYAVFCLKNKKNTHEIITYASKTTHQQE